MPLRRTDIGGSERLGGDIGGRLRGYVRSARPLAHIPEVAYALRKRREAEKLRQAYKSSYKDLVARGRKAFARHPSSIVAPGNRETWETVYSSGSADQPLSYYMASVTSSWVHSIRYDGVTKALTIEFKDGAICRYDGVPQRIAAMLQVAPSKGEFLHSAWFKPWYHNYQLLSPGGNKSLRAERLRKIRRNVRY